MRSLHAVEMTAGVGRDDFETTAINGVRVISKSFYSDPVMSG